MERKLTEEELREIRIVELAYEMQQDDDDDEPGDGSLKDEYYEMAKREIEEEEREARGGRPGATSSTP